MVTLRKMESECVGVSYSADCNKCLEHFVIIQHNSFLSTVVGSLNVRSSFPYFCQARIIIHKMLSKALYVPKDGTQNICLGTVLPSNKFRTPFSLVMVFGQHFSAESKRLRILNFCFRTKYIWVPVDLKACPRGNSCTPVSPLKFENTEGMSVYS